MKNVLSKDVQAMLVSWSLWFVGIFATTLLGTVQAHMESHTLPLVSPVDLVNALWAAGGALVAVAVQYMDKRYSRYGVKAPAEAE